ncbi:glycosyltransferase [Prevotella melaninogenica]
MNSIVLQKNYNQRIEILLVNDGATDNSLSIINDLSLRYENINIILRENR